MGQGHNERHPPARGQAAYRRMAVLCPQCGTAVLELSWFYFRSPPATWRGECGCEGWLVICDSCQAQVSFFCEVIS